MKTLFATLLLCLFVLSPAYAQHVFVVSSQRGYADLLPGDGECRSLLGPCTLRAAIQEANALANSPDGPDEIHFSANLDTSFVIAMSVNVLPAITDALVIDATTAPGSVFLDGASITGNGITLAAGSDGSTIKGMTIGNFPEAGIYVESEENTILDNYLGTNAAGDDLGNGGAGLYLSEDGGDNIVGGRDAGNVIGFNGDAGVFIASSRNVVAGNFIGTDVEYRPLGNQRQGISVSRGFSNVIGEPDAGNFIGFNVGDGIQLWSGGVAIRSTVIQHNYIGTNAQGDPMGNGATSIGSPDGISVYFAEETTITHNVIGFSQGAGIDVGGPFSTIKSNYVGVGSGGENIGNGNEGIRLSTSGNQVGGNLPEDGNVIGFNENGIELVFGSETVPNNNIIENNFVGTTRAWTNAGNTGFGIWVTDGENNLVGLPGSGNVVGFNKTGIAVWSSERNLIRSNFIGTNAAGLPMGNREVGLHMSECEDEQVGGRGFGQGNVIGFNGAAGIESGACEGMVIEGNYIGTNAAGEDLGNVGYGIVLGAESSNNIVGYPPHDPIVESEARGNHVRFNHAGGITIPSDFRSYANTIRGNVIGSNLGLGIDLFEEGFLINDSEDADDGPNTLLNHPEWQSLNYNAAQKQLEIVYTLDVANTAAVFPLTIDLYLGDGSSDTQGRSM